MNLGSWKIDDNLTFTCNTHRVDTGAATDADSPPTYRVYEDETGTPLLTGSMALLDDGNTVGFYSEQIALSAANGFEKGKCYSIRIAATVNSVSGAVIRTFQIEAEVDANVVSDSAVASASNLATVAGYLDTEVAAIKAKTDLIPASPAAVGSAMTLAADAVSASALAADAVAEIQSGLATAANLATVAGYLDTEVAAIKAKTDALPASPAATGDIPAAAAIADAVWDEAMSGHVADGSFGARFSVPHMGTAQAGGASSITLAAGASAADNLYQFSLIYIYAGTGAGQTNSIASYVGSTKAAAVDNPWGVVPDATSKYVIIPSSVAPATVSGTVNAQVVGMDPSVLTAAALAADAVAEIQSGLATAAALATVDDFLDTEIAAIKAKTDALPAAPAAVGSAMTLATDAVSAEAMSAAAVAEIQSGLATAANLATVAGYVDTEVAAIKAKTDLIPATPAATGDIPTASAIADAVLDDAVEGTFTLRKILRAALAWIGALTLGAGTTNPRFRDQANTKNRIDMTVNTTTGERSAVTLDLD